MTRLMVVVSCFALGCLILESTSGIGQTTQNTAHEITPAMKCASLIGFQIPDLEMQITKADPIPAAPANTINASAYSALSIPVAVPSYCHAEGVIDKRVGVNGKIFAIGFAIALPDSWSGQFLFQGGGGLNGSIQPPYGAVAAGNSPAITRGMAVVSTDGGHKGDLFDPSFMRDQQAGLDFAQRSIERVTAAAKQIIAHYYGQPAKRSYFAGCSTGGREGMLVSQRFPLEFDGVVAGDPAMNTGDSNLALAWATVAFNQIAPKGGSDVPLTAKDYSPADKKLLIDSILSACDTLDGLKDGMIFNLQACRFDPSVLTCKGEKTDTCLTPQQVDALKKAFGGPKDSRGLQVYAPFPYDTGIAADSPGSLPGFLPSNSGYTPFGPNFSTQINVDEIEAKIDGDALQKLVDTNLWTNLSTFSSRGGKIIFYHGSSDPWFSPLATLDYYKRLTKDNGGEDKVRGWSRFFFVPGMSHCGGGPASLDQFDFLGAIVDWVEKGTAPDSVISTGRAFAGRSRPLCAYPNYAHYKGAGNTEDAANFECKTGDGPQ